MPKPSNEGLQRGLRNRIRKRVEDTVYKVVRANLNEKRTAEIVAKLKKKYQGLPQDALAGILIKRAVRKTTVEGTANGGAITALEVVLVAPSPEPGTKAAAAAGIVALISGDVTYTTRIQIQLLLDLAHLYDCPFDVDDEEDVWLIFKAALGLKGAERVAAYGRFIFYQAAKKQFRKLLRTGIRKAVQERVIKIAGRQVARYLGEKSLMRLVPVANAAIGGAFNNRVTKSVGKWAKVKAKVRSSTLKQLKKLKSGASDDRIWILPIIFHVGTADDKLTDNILTLYAHTMKNLELSEEEKTRVEELNEDEQLRDALKQALPKISNKKTKEALFDVALTTAAVNLKATDEHHKCLREVGGFLGIKYQKSLLSKRVQELKR